MFGKPGASTHVGSDDGDHEIYLRLALGAGEMAVWQYDLATNRFSGTPQLFRLLGFAEDEEPDVEEVRSRYFPGDLLRIQGLADAAHAQGRQTFETDFRYRLTDGSVRWLMLRAEIMRGDEGEPARYLGVMFDISGRRSSELELARETTVRSAILDTTLDCIITIDQESRVIEWNSAAEQTFGFSRGEALGCELGGLIIPDELRAAHSSGMLNYLATGEGPAIGKRIEMEALRADGSRFPVELAISEAMIAGRRYFTAVLRDITERRQQEKQRQLLTREMAHRMKNIFALVQTVTTQTLRQADNVDVAIHAIHGRLAALSQAQEGLVAANWEAASIAEIVNTVLEPYQTDSGRISLNGPPAQIDGRQALALSLAMHELATNAVKYGALSNETGVIDVVWSANPVAERFRLEWVESGGPPVTPPRSHGFGSRMIERALGSYFDGTASIHYDRQGVRFILDAPLAAIVSLA